MLNSAQSSKYSTFASPLPQKGAKRAQKGRQGVGGDLKAKYQSDENGVEIGNDGVKGRRKGMGVFDLDGEMGRYDYLRGFGIGVWVRWDNG